MAALCPVCGGPTSVGKHPSADCEFVRKQRLQGVMDQEIFEKLLTPESFSKWLWDLMTKDSK